jgi:hypothetical protein
MWCVRLFRKKVVCTVKVHQNYTPQPSHTQPNDHIEQMVAMLAMKELEDRKTRKSHMFILLRYLLFIILNHTCVKMPKTHFQFCCLLSLNLM